MLLATKCPHCKTTFRVANDQLKLQAGLVRCGVCQQIFNGIEHLAGTNPSLTTPVSALGSASSVPASAAISAPTPAPNPVHVPATTPAKPVVPAAVEATSPAQSAAKSSAPLIRQPSTPVPAQHEAIAVPTPATAAKEISVDDLEFDLPGIASAPALDSTAVSSLSATDFSHRVEPQLVAEPDPATSFSNSVDSIIGTIGSRTKAQLEAEVQALLDADLQGELLAKNSESSELSALPGFTAVEPSLYSAPTPAATSKHDETIVVAPAFSEFDETHNTPRVADDVLLDYAQQEGALSDSESNGEDDLDNIDQLRFIRQAKNKKRTLLLLSAGTVCMLLLLIGQATYQFRDLIAAMYPASKDTLVTLCSYAQCKIKLPAQIDALSYEADELHSLPHDNTFELSMLLHNRSNLPQQWPNIELTLKNTQKQAILRRVFTPADYLANARDIQTGFQANQEQSVKMYFEVAQLKASDFVVAIFYP